MLTRVDHAKHAFPWVPRPKFRLSPEPRRRTTQSMADFFGGFPVLETERLRLRELEDRDALPLLTLLGDAEVMKYLRVPWEPPRNLEDCTRSVARLRERFYDDSFVIPWAIALKAGPAAPDSALKGGGADRLIGSIRYFSFSGHMGMIGEIAFELARAHWRQGLMTEALHAAVALGFDAIGLNRIQATTHPDNLAAQRVAVKAGMRREGLLRAWCYDQRDDEWGDALMFSILRTDSRPRPHIALSIRR